MIEENNMVQGGLSALSRQIKESIGFAVNPFSIKVPTPTRTEPESPVTRPMAYHHHDDGDFCRWTD